MNKQSIVLKKCIDDSITIKRHCNTPFCSTRILEVNPAVGCEFQCQYCCLYTQENENQFSEIKVYNDYPEMLEDYIIRNKKDLDGFTFFFSFESDCFQNALIECGMTRSILRIFDKYQMPYFLLTKGGPPSGDVADLLTKAGKYNQIIINDTMPDESLRMKLEPFAATCDERFDLARFCIDNDIPVTISFSPMLPLDEFNYVKEKILKYTSIGIKHFRFDLLELSKESYKKIVSLIPEYENELSRVYEDNRALENLWKLPGKNILIKRYKPNQKFMIKHYGELTAFVKTADKNATVSICDGVTATVKELKNFNNDAYDHWINCMGVMF